jgi:demethylmenaquinone methyltransferase / 2-methoxy-6-polyprenyl-1,4-benzoquinol methylase
MTRASLDKKPHEVAAMFDRVAKRYDVTNTVMAFAQDRRWRRATRIALDLRPTDRCLDLAAGTAVSSVELAKSGADVIACDFSLGMLQEGQGRGIPLIAGDAMHLPFADASFDAVTISFGLRNVVGTEAALREMARVTKPGGRLVVCEFSHPTWTPFRTIYSEYLMKALPEVARRVSSNPEAYVYLAESIREWPDQPALSSTIAAAGWRKVAWRNLTGGVVALHRAIR